MGPPENAAAAHKRPNPKPAPKPKAAAKPKPGAGKAKVAPGKAAAAQKPSKAKTAAKPKAAAKPKPGAGKAKAAPGKAAAAQKPSKGKTAAKPKAPAGKPPPKKSKPKGPVFRQNDNVVYPAHGVGQIQGIVKQPVGATAIRLLVIYFEREKMTLRIPADSASERGLRPLSSLHGIRGALKILTGPAKIRRMMWSRRAQEYEAKINSGNLVSVAEVVRDLHRADDQGQSYSERQLYDQARDRLTREIMAVQKIPVENASTRIDEVLRQRTA